MLCVPAWPQESRVFAGWLKSSFPSFAISLRSSYLSLQCDRRLPFLLSLLSVFFFRFFSFSSRCSYICVNKTRIGEKEIPSQRPNKRRGAKIAHLLLMKPSLQPKIFSLSVTIDNVMPCLSKNFLRRLLLPSPRRTVFISHPFFLFFLFFSSSSFFIFYLGRSR